VAPWLRVSERTDAATCYVSGGITCNSLICSPWPHVMGASNFCRVSSVSPVTRDPRYVILESPDNCRVNVIFRRNDKKN
jgi:hypothetical protein